MDLSNLTPAKGSVKSRKRIGRGEGSGRGGTSTKGHKGAKSRSGYKSKAGFEGGQMPLYRRVPKGGFKNINRIEYRGINLDALQKLVDEKNINVFNLEVLIDHGLAQKKDLIKVLGRGKLKSAIQVTVHANAYDLVINGVEIGGGSIRIFDKLLQQKMFQVLGFTQEEAQNQFGFLMNAFEYGAPPHGGIALGFDRLVSLFGGSDSIRDFIAFPKNNAGRDVMIDAPSQIAKKQLDELGLIVVQKGK